MKSALATLQTMSSSTRQSAKVAPVDDVAQPKQVYTHKSEYGIARINTREFISQKTREKAYDIQFGIIAQVFEFLIGVGSLVVGVFLYLQPTCSSSSAICPGAILLLGAGVGITLDGLRRLFFSVRNGDWAIAIGGASKVTQDKLDAHVAMSVMPSSFHEQSRKKGFTSAHSLNAVNDLIEPKNTVASKDLIKKRVQRRCLLADSRMRLSQDLFQYYSKNGSNATDGAEACIDCNGLVEVMLDTMSNGAESITLDESKKFMARIDLDNDMLLQSNEFYNFLFNVWKVESPLYINNVYATLGDMIYNLHSKHVGMTSTVARKELDLAKLSTEEKNLLRVERIRDIYDWYDKNKAGAIDCNGLMQLVSDLVANKPGGELTLREVKKFLEQVDDNGDMLLQCDELVHYMETSWLKDAPIAQEFEDLDGFLNLAYPKYQRLLRDLWKKNAGFDADDLPLTQAATISNSMAAKDLLELSEKDSNSDGEEKKVPPPVGLPPVIQRKLKVLVATLWECYADDEEAELNPSQLKSLLDDHISTSKVPDEECRRFIQCMDIDGNDSISKEEFKTFVSQGLFMDDEQKKIYRKRSNMHTHLVEFLERIEDLVTAQEISEDASIDFKGEQSEKKQDGGNGDVDATIQQFQLEESAKEESLDIDGEAA